MNEDGWLDDRKREKLAAGEKKGDELFRRPVAQCAMEQMIFDELAEEEERDRKSRLRDELLKKPAR